MDSPTGHRIVMPPLVGRRAALGELLTLAGRRVGAVAVAGPRGVGRRRLIHELAARLSLDGALTIEARGTGPSWEVICRCLDAAGQPADPTMAARVRPLAILLGDDPSDLDELARRLRGTRALVLAAARGPVDEVATLILDPLDEGACRELAAHVAPSASAAHVDELVALARGLPGRLVPLAAAAAEAHDPGGALPIPAALSDPILHVLSDLPSPDLEAARWLSITGRPTPMTALAHLAGAPGMTLGPALERLERRGLAREVAGPPGPRWQLEDPLTAAVVRQGLGPAAIRRRSAAALGWARRRGHPPAERLALAIAAADAASVVREGIAAAADSRERGDPQRALAQATTATDWWAEDTSSPDEHHALLFQRGMALLDLSAWADAAELLERAAHESEQYGNDGRALASITAASSAYWSMGRHDTALSCLQDHLDHVAERHTEPSAARAEALTQAAGMAVMTSRFAQAEALARAARLAAQAADARESATRALTFLGMATVGRGDDAGLLHLAQARREGAAERGSARRNETLAAIHQSHVLLALGRPSEAARLARAGRERARDLGLAEHEHVLAGNLGEALTALGRLDEATLWIERASAGWHQLGLNEPTPAAPGAAWLTLARGEVVSALDAHRELDGALGEAGLFEQRAASATGHILAAMECKRPDEGVRVARAVMGAWMATDDRLLAPPLLAACCLVPEATVADRAHDALARLAAAPGSHAAVAAFAQLGHGLRRRTTTPGRAAIDLRSAATRFDRLELNLWAAYALLWAGSVAPDGPWAVDDLLSARGRLREAGAEGWSRRAEAILRGRGVRVATPGRPRRQGAPNRGLSDRELEVLELLALGLRNRDIGDRLYISERTVARHLGHIYAKLEVSTRTEAVAVARSGGILDPEPATD